MKGVRHRQKARPRDKTGLFPLPECVGLACYWCWGYLAFHTPLILMPESDNYDLGVCYLSSMLGTFFTMVLSVLRSELITKAVSKRPLMWAFASASSLLTLIMRLGIGTSVGLVSAWLSGVFIAFLPLKWSLNLGLREPSIVRRAIPAAIAMASVSTILGHLLPPSIGLLLLLSMPIGSCALNPSAPTRAVASIRNKSLKKTALSMLPFLLSVLMFSASLGTFRGVLLDGIGGNPLMGSIVFFGGMTAAGALLFLTGAQHEKKMQPVAIYKVALPVTVASLMFLNVETSYAPYISGLTMGGGFALYDAATWILSLNVAYQTRTSPVILTGLSRVAAHIGMLTGAAVGSAMETGLLDTPFVLSVTVIALIAAVMPSLGNMRIVSVQTPSAFLETPAPAGTAGVISLQDRFSLTDREAQVASYLAAGCTREHIQKELFLSASTVKTHVGHIYEKTGAHSKQELMSLIQSLSDQP